MKRKLYILLAALALVGLTATAQIKRGSKKETPPKTEQTQKKEGTTTKSNKGGSKKNNQQSAVEKQRRQQEEADRQRLAEEQRRQQEEAKRQRAEAEELRRQQEELAQQRAAFEEQRRQQQEDAERMRIIQQAIDDMVYVEGGTFKMGVTKVKDNNLSNEVFAQEDEKPIHKVTLYSYYIGKYEVTQELWQAVMGDNPSWFKGDLKRPVERVSWEDCQEFIHKLNQLTGKCFRLPTEAEWEYAARGGKKSKGYQFAGSNTLLDVAWVTDVIGELTHPVGSKSPNELGLYDMSGNVAEWCQDFYDNDYYSHSSSTNPIGPSTGDGRVIRGGSLHHFYNLTRVSARVHTKQSDASIDVGFRLAM